MGIFTAGITWLGKIVEKLTNMTVAAYIRETIFIPLGMNNSSYVWEGRSDSTRASDHDWQGKVMRNQWTPEDTSCSLQTTAEDYARFIIAVMNRQLLSPATWEEVFKPQVCVNTSAPLLYWGLGWGLEMTDNNESCWQWSNGDNSKGYVTADLTGKNAIVFFANSANGLFFAKELVTDAIGGEHPALTYLDYQRYDSPSWLLLSDIMHKGAVAALAEYKDKSLTPYQMNNIGYRLINVGRLRDAVEVFRRNIIDFPKFNEAWNGLAAARQRLER